ncbi:hypothetical protein KKH59_05315, partial [Patescibacteria group bacterium]|nr:hypothetical protein [Patescibacteria group bacterium]
MMKKILLFLIPVLIFSFFAANEANASASDNVWGWAYSENIGWISFNAENTRKPLSALGGLVIKSDGTLWEDLSQVGTDTNWWVVSNSFGITRLAIKTDGTLWAWGWNEYGQLGLGDTTDRTVPTQVGTDANWLSVSAT